MSNRLICLSLLLIGASVCAVGQEFPTDAEMQHDLFKRQHEVQCTKLNINIQDRMANDMANHVPLSIVNGLTPEEQKLSQNCGIKLAKIEIKQAGGCFDSAQMGSGSDWYSVFTVRRQGAKDLYYSLLFDQADQEKYNIKFGEYYKISYWHFVSHSEHWNEYDHPLSVQILGKCE